MRSLIDITDFSVEELYDLLEVASDIGEHPEKYADACRGKKLATLFLSLLPVPVSALRRLCTSLAAV